MAKRNPDLLPTFGDMTEEEQSIRWENDPSLLPHTPERVARAEAGLFDYYQRSGKTPEQACPNDPEFRAKYRQYLKDNKKA